MPPLSRPRIETLAEFARELRYTPPEAARRQLVRAEALALELLDELSAEGGSGRTYPDEYVLFRITGYRPERAPGRGPVMLVGEALLGDLVGLVERLSVRAGVRREELDSEKDGAWLGIEDLCARWGVSRKTIERWRKRGLVGRRALLGGGRAATYFHERAVRAFETRRSGAIGAARGFTRIPEEERRRIVRRAARYRRRLGCSLNACAERLSARFGRGVETVRQILRKHDAEASAAGGEPVFGDRGPVTAREKRVVERAGRSGVSRARVARRLGKSRASVYRIELDRRADRLRGLDLNGPVGPLFGREEAAEVLLAPAPMRSGLGRAGAASVAELVAEAARAEPPERAVEEQRAVAYWLLRFLARRAIEGLARHGVGAGRLDEIETRLRWASRLKAELVRSQIPLLVRTVRAGTGQGLEAMPGAAAARLAARCLEALSEGVEHFDPFRGGRLAAPAGLALNRAVSTWQPSRDAATRGSAGVPAGRAVPRAEAGAGALEDWARRVNPWQAWLELPASARAWAEGAGTEASRVVLLRMGWDDGPPRTKMEVAGLLGVRSARVAALERAAARAWLGREREA